MNKDPRDEELRSHCGLEIADGSLVKLSSCVGDESEVLVVIEKSEEDVEHDVKVVEDSVS
jgi:hypothetical protein